jgi:hypothetical protein
MRDLRELDAPMPRIEECGVQASVRIERVVGSISAPVFLPFEASPTDAGFEELDGAADDRPGVMLTASAGRSVAIALAVGFAAGFALHDVRAGLGAAIAAWLLLEIQGVVDMIPFSFGEGFVGYRGDQGWPQGVQEDDDVKWSWNASRTSGPARPNAAIPGR